MQKPPFELSEQIDANAQTYKDIAGIGPARSDAPPHTITELPYRSDSMGVVIKFIHP